MGVGLVASKSSSQVGVMSGKVSPSHTNLPAISYVFVYGVACTYCDTVEASHAANALAPVMMGSTLHQRSTTV